jgi:hypothetical protein
METSMRKPTVALALLTLISSVTIAEARGGRTSVADCDAGSADPDCPDAPATQSKPASSPTPPGAQIPPAPPRK